MNQLLKTNNMKKRVTGIGGLFFKSENPKAAKEWYQKHLGFNTDAYGAPFWWKDKAEKTPLRNGVHLQKKPIILSLPKKTLCLIIELRIWKNCLPY